MHQTIKNIVVLYLRKIGIFAIFVFALYTAYNWRVKDLEASVQIERQQLDSCRSENKRREAANVQLYERIYKILDR